MPYKRFLVVPMPLYSHARKNRATAIFTLKPYKARKQEKTREKARKQEEKRRNPRTLVYFLPVFPYIYLMVYKTAQKDAIFFVQYSSLQYSIAYATIQTVRQTQQKQKIHNIQEDIRPRLQAGARNNRRDHRKLSRQLLRKPASLDNARFTQGLQAERRDRRRAFLPDHGRNRNLSPQAARRPHNERKQAARPVIQTAKQPRHPQPEDLTETPEPETQPDGTTEKGPAQRERATPAETTDRAAQ